LRKSLRFIEVMFSFGYSAAAREQVSWAQTADLPGGISRRGSA
jgi:hypothetical protein